MLTSFGTPSAVLSNSGPELSDWGIGVAVVGRRRVESVRRVKVKACMMDRESRNGKVQDKATQEYML